MPSRGKTGIAAFLKMAQTEGVTEICSESPNPVTAWWPSLLQATREGSKIFSHVGSKSASTTDLTTADHGTSSSLMGPRIFSLPLNQSQSRTFPIFNIIFNIVCVCAGLCLAMGLSAPSRQVSPWAGRDTVQPLLSSAGALYVFACSLPLLGRGSPEEHIPDVQDNERLQAGPHAMQIMRLVVSKMGHGILALPLAECAKYRTSGKLLP